MAQKILCRTTSSSSSSINTAPVFVTIYTWLYASYLRTDHRHKNFSHPPKQFSAQDSSRAARNLLSCYAIVVMCRGEKRTNPALSSDEIWVIAHDSFRRMGWIGDESPRCDIRPLPPGGRSRSLGALGASYRFPKTVRPDEYCEKRSGIMGRKATDSALLFPVLGMYWAI